MQEQGFCPRLHGATRAVRQAESFRKRFGAHDKRFKAAYRRAVRIERTQED